MADPQNTKRIAQEFINFGTKSSNAGLSYLRAQQHQEQIDEVDRVARAKVLKERLHEAEMEGRKLAAGDPKMSVESQILALQEKVGLQIDDPNYKALVEATNKGFELKKAEVSISKYNAEVKRDAKPTSERLYQQYLVALEGVTTPQGEVVEEKFTGSFIQYTAEQLEEVRTKAIGEMIGSNKFFTTVLSAEGKYLNYGPIKSEVAKKQGELDHQQIFRDGLTSATSDINLIMINGSDQPGVGTYTSGQSLKFITDELKYRGLSKDEVNRIVFVSMMSGLEVQVEKEGTDLIGTNYFDNIIDLLHYRDSDSKNGISQFEKDREGSAKIITKIREYEKNLNAEFEKGTQKRSKTEEEKLVMEATSILSNLVASAYILDVNGNPPTKSAISKLLAETYQYRQKGEKLYGMKFMDATVRTEFRTRLEKLLEQAEEDQEKVLEKDDTEFLGKIESSVSNNLSIINSTEFKGLGIESKPSDFQTHSDRLDIAEENIRGLETETINRLGYNWKGSKEFFQKLRKGLDDIGAARGAMSKIELSASNEKTQEGLALKFEDETNTYDNKIVKILQRDEPRLSTLMRDMKLLSSTDPEDINLYTQKHAEVMSILNQVLIKPSYNKVNGRIIKSDEFVFNEVSRRSFRTNISAIGLARAKAASETKIIINPAGSRDFRAKISRSLTALGVNSQASTFDEQIKKIQGMQVETTNAFEQNRISEPTFTTMERQLKSALTNLDGLVNKNYGSIKIFDDSKDKLAMKLTGYSTEGIKINIINSSHKVIFGVFEQEHEALQNHLVDLSDTFTEKKIIPAVGTKEERKITQEGMFMSGVNYHNKRIRELAFTKHRNKMTGADTTESILKYAEIMEKSGKWSEEEIRIIEEVATFESIPGVTAYLNNGYKNINTAGDNKFAKGYATRNLGEQKKPKKTEVDVKEKSSLMKEFLKGTTVNTTGTDINISSANNLLVPDMKTTENSISNINLAPLPTIVPESTDTDINSLLAPVVTE